MKRLSIALLLLPALAVAADSVARYAFACRAPRREVVVQAADIFARFDYRVTYANPEVGILTAEKVLGSGDAYHLLLVSVAADGDSLRITATRNTTVTGGELSYSRPDDDEISPLLKELRSMSTDPLGP